MSRIHRTLFLCLTILSATFVNADDGIGIARLYGRFVCAADGDCPDEVPLSVVMTDDVFLDTLMSEVNSNGCFSFVTPLPRPMLFNLHLDNRVEYVYLAPGCDTRIEVPISRANGIDYQDIKQNGRYVDLAGVWNKRCDKVSIKEYETVNARIEEFLTHDSYSSLSYLDSLSVLLKDQRVLLCPKYSSLCQKLMDIHYMPPQYVADEIKVRWLKKQLWDKHEYLDEQQDSSTMRLSPAYKQYVELLSMHLPARMRIISCDTTITPYTNSVFPETILSGQLKSHRKRKSESISNREITVVIHYSYSGLFKTKTVTDDQGRFSIALSNCRDEEDACVSFSLKGEDYKQYYITLNQYSHSNQYTEKETSIPFTGIIRYDIDTITDSLCNKGKKIPMFLDWLFKVDKRFEGTYGHLVPFYQNYYEGDKLLDSDGPSYKDHPIIWILDDKVKIITGRRSITSEGWQAYNTTRDHITHNLDEVRSVYVSLQDNVWKPWFRTDNLSAIKPATVFVYTHPTTISSRNVIRKIYCKTH